MGAATFLFADVAGFTALTEAHGDERAVELIDDLERRATELGAKYGAELVKTIGDAFMMRVPEASDAVQLGLDLAHDLATGHGSPAIRVGMHHGEAVERGGDYFGSAVNLAARVSGEASGGDVLLTMATCEAAGHQVEGVVVEPHGRFELRNVAEPVELCRAMRAGETAGAERVTDPVCRMTLDPERALGRFNHEGQVYFFCSLDCVRHFAERPELYAQPPDA